jgi:molybdenum cofactor cytidylyltransferase
MIDENTAAGRLAGCVRRGGVRVEAPATGRANLFAEAAGVLVVDRAGVDSFNRVDDAITLATLPEYRAVQRGRDGRDRQDHPARGGGSCRRSAATGSEAARVWSESRLTAHIRSAWCRRCCRRPREKMLDKTARVLGERLEPSGSSVLREARVAHRPEAVAEAHWGDLWRRARSCCSIFGASAIVDRGDVIPRAIEQAGGKVVHFGMPVDPGNLLLLGEVSGRPVLGAPGCARSPKENGFDWVLQRLLAGIPVAPTTSPEWVSGGC